MKTWKPVPGQERESAISGEGPEGNGRICAHMELSQPMGKCLCLSPWLFRILNLVPYNRAVSPEPLVM